MAEMSTNGDVARRLRLARANRGYTREFVADALPILDGPEALAEIEAGLRPLSSVRLALLANLYDLPVDAFFSADFAYALEERPGEWGDLSEEAVPPAQEERGLQALLGLEAAERQIRLAKRRVALRAYADGEISLGKLAESFGVDREAARRLVTPRIARAREARMQEGGEYEPEVLEVLYQEDDNKTVQDEGENLPRGAQGEEGEEPER